MALTRNEKAQLIDDISEKLDGASIVYLTNPKGLSVGEANDLRSRFFEADVQFTVVKNTLARIAMERVGGFGSLADHLSGPTALAISESPSAPARAIQDFLEENDEVERPELKVAYVEGDLYEASELGALASLKSREELIGDILSLLMAPAQNVVAGLQSQGSRLAGAIQALSEREE